MWITLLIIFICSFFAFSISAICGGGAGLMLIPILGGLLPIAQVPAALSIGTFTSSASRIIIFYQNISWNIVKYFVPAALPGVWLGAWFLKFVNPLYLEIAMGIFLVSNIPFIFKKSEKMQANQTPTKFILLVIGFLAGFLSGLTGAVGLVFNKFYLRYGLTKEEIIATRAANEIILHLIKIILYTLFGLISIQVISIGLAVAVAALFSTWAMKWILPRISEALFKKIGYIAMSLSGFMMLRQAGKEIVHINEVTLSAYTKSKGLETKLQWQNADYALEFKYDEGFEFEQVIPFTDLSLEHQKFVLSKQNQADKIIIESVYEIGKQSYEAYYFKNHELIHKIDF